MLCWADFQSLLNSEGAAFQIPVQYSRSPHLSRRSRYLTRLYKRILASMAWPAAMCTAYFSAASSSALVFIRPDRRTSVYGGH
ncbi:hypothetical protein BDW75DRAFT_199493 [Aspergillus navahoensis]